MQQVNEAYQVLSDPRRRAEHDAALRRERCRRAGDASAPVPAIEASVPAQLDNQAQHLTASAFRRARIARFYAAHAQPVEGRPG